MNDTVTVQKAEDIIAGSGATPEFKQAALALAAQKPQDRITFNPGAPPVKVLRFTLKLLEAMPEAAVERLRVDAASGCSDFSGKAVAKIAGGGERLIDFKWDCAWRAKERGWEDDFGFADQIRAAREFGYQCFEKFEATDRAGA